MTDKTVKPAAAEINLETIKANHTDIVVALMAEGAKAENERIKDCEAQLIPGHEAIVNAMKLDGKSNGADVAKAIIAEEKKLRGSHLKAFQDNAPPVVQFAATAEVEPVAVSDDKNLPIEERTKAKWNADSNLRAEFGGNYTGYLAFCKAEEAGKVRILGSK